MKKFSSFVLSLLILAAVAVFFACDPKKDTIPEPEEETCVHEIKSYEIITEPTMESVGEAIGVCEKCGKEYKYYVPVLGKENYEVTGVPPTCTEEGSTTYSSMYGTFNVKEKATGHKFGKPEVTEPTCTGKGKTVEKCSVCGFERTEITDEKAHSYEITDREEADCTHKGYVTYRCKYCDDGFTVDGKDFVHVWDDGERVGAICPNKAYTVYVCTLCEEEKTVYDNSPAHVYDKATGKCTVCDEKCKHVFDGYVCSSCGSDIEERVKEDGFFLCDENGNGEADVGEKIYFGFYPKSIVSDRELIEVLSCLEPEEGNVYVYENDRYVKKPLDQRLIGNIRFSDGSTLTSAAFAKGYFYREEPIAWTVVSDSDGILIESDYILDVTDYLPEDEYSWVAAKGTYMTSDGLHYACEWESSALREFSGYLLMRAFDEKQRGLILPTVNGNGSASNYYKEKEHAKCGDTEDFLFVAAYADLFGEEEAFDTPSAARTKELTDYVIGSGIDLTDVHGGRTGKYYTRSAGLKANNIGIIDEYGKFLTEGALYSVHKNGNTVSGVGVVPRVRISLK